MHALQGIEHRLTTLTRAEKVQVLPLRRLSSIMLALGNDNQVAVWVRCTTVGVPTLHHNLAEADGLEHHDNLMLVVPAQPMRTQLGLHQTPLCKDFMSHPDML